jgi:dTDP-4-dehydrorhamnose 3,5-epimerase
LWTYSGRGPADKCGDYYDPTHEHSIAWNDPDIGVAWGITDPLLSAKDMKYSTLAAAPREWLPQYQVKSPCVS